MSLEAEAPVLQAVELLDSDFVEVMEPELVEPTTQEAVHAADLLNGSCPLSIRRAPSGERALAPGDEGGEAEQLALGF